jgi:aminopeptidase-like protein
MLKVGEVIVEGESEDTFVLAAHLCHPAMVSDDLSGVVVGIDVMRYLLQQPKPYYTYRLLLVPETIGSVAYLSHHESLIPKMKGGLFLESLGLDTPHVLQGSLVGGELQKNPQADRCLETALRGLDDQAAIRPYRSVVKNDEVQFNAPGVRVPMLSLRGLVGSTPSGPSFKAIIPAWIHLNELLKRN